MVFILFMLIVLQSTAQFNGGDGSEETPYQIATLEQLQLIKNEGHLDKYFIQTGDIDAGDTENWNEGKGFDN